MVGIVCYPYHFAFLTNIMRIAIIDEGWWKMMKINIQQVKDNIGAKQKFSFKFSAADLFGDDEHFWLDDVINVAGEIVNDGLVLKMSGTIQITGNFECDRCLEKYVTSITIPFMEEFRENADVADLDEFSTYNGDEIELDDLIRENIILAKPIKMVCSEGCRGLCPNCGTNLNFSTCACENDIIDPRLAALKQLLDRK